MLPWLVTIFSALTMFLKDALMPPPPPALQTPQMMMSRQMMNRPYNGMFVDTPMNTQYRNDRQMVPQNLPLRQQIQGGVRGRQAQQWPALPLCHSHCPVSIIQIRHPANVVSADPLKLTGMCAAPGASGNVMQEGCPITRVIAARHAFMALERARVQR